MDRFPDAYAFQLIKDEALGIVRLRSSHPALKRGQNIKYLPTAFTEHGAVMLAAVLRSPAAVAASLRVVDAFVRLRAIVVERDGLGRKVETLEKRADGHDQQIGRIFKVLNDIIPTKESEEKKRIGFTPP